jgi:hypothetical protein
LRWLRGKPELFFALFTALFYKLSFNGNAKVVVYAVYRDESLDDYAASSLSARTGCAIVVVDIRTIANYAIKARLEQKL